MPTRGIEAVASSALTLHLMQIIDRQYSATPFYGVPRMTEFIRQVYGYRINEKRVKRLYKVMDIRAIGPNPHTSRPGKTSYKFPCLLRGLAITKHTKPQIFNTDQGSQFTSDLFVKLLTGEQIQISMDGKGRAIDNIFIERF